MNGTNGNQPGYPENALVPYPVIVAATKGDPDAMKMVLQHFSGYIARLKYSSKVCSCRASSKVMSEKVTSFALCVRSSL